MVSPSPSPSWTRHLRSGRPAPAARLRLLLLLPPPQSDAWEQRWSGGRERCWAIRLLRCKSTSPPPPRPLPRAEGQKGALARRPPSSRRGALLTGGASEAPIPGPSLAHISAREGSFPVQSLAQFDGKGPGLKQLVACWRGSIH